MDNYAYLFTIKHPFEKNPVFILSWKDKISVTYDSKKMFDLKKQKIVTLNFDTSLEYFVNKKNKLFPIFYEMELAKKLLSGMPKSYFNENQEPWALSKILGAYLQKDTLNLIHDITNAKIDIKDVFQKLEFESKNIIEACKNIWKNICMELEKDEEKDRFFNIEVPIYNIFLKTSINGICVTNLKINQRILKIRKDYFKGLKMLEFDYDLNISSIYQELPLIDLLKKEDLKLYADELNYDFWNTVELYKHENNLFEALHYTKKNFIDMNALLRYSIDLFDKIYPKYDIQGTITSRILITNPGIQYLRKTNRDIISPKKGYTHLYADFDRFEPGIIASISKDKNLIELYNEGDIYDKLSETLFGNKENRKIAKILFLSFMYGMSKEKLLKLVNNKGGEKAKVACELFFSRFDTLVNWKKNICEQAIDDKCIKSFLGNRRIIREIDIKNYSAQRWIPNQIIQGTASYILKKSIIELSNLDLGINFLVPMHDAILVEVKNEEVEKIKSKIKEIFEREFKKVCPEINTSVSFDSFFE